MANLLYNLAQPFSDTKQYTQGAIVIYNDRMYEMTADEYTPGPFDPEKFTERFLSEMISGKLNSNLMNLGVLSSGANYCTKAYTEVASTIDTDISSGILVVATGSASSHTKVNGITLTSGTFEEIHSNEFNVPSKTSTVCIMKMYKVKNIEAGTTLTVNGVGLYNALYTILG